MTTSDRIRFGFLALSGVLSLQGVAACGGDTATAAGTGTTAGSAGNGGTGPGTTGGGPGSSTVGGGAGPSTTGGGAGGFSTTASPTTTGGPSSASLFACELDLTCDPVCSHLGALNDCGGDAACVESVWGSGESGIVLQQSRPGPGGVQLDTLFVLLGDGQVLRQLRVRACPDGEFNCLLEAIPWSVETQQRCEVGTSYTLEVRNCVDVDYSCDDVKTGLEGLGGAGGGVSGGAAGADGDTGHAGEAAE